MMRPGVLTAELGDLAGLPIVTSDTIPVGRFYSSARPDVAGGILMCHPRSLERLEAGLEAVAIVRAGMADVLEWLGDAYPPKPAPRNAPMPTRHLAPMLERLRKVGAVHSIYAAMLAELREARRRATS